MTKQDSKESCCDETKKCCNCCEGGQIAAFLRHVASFFDKKN